MSDATPTDSGPAGRYIEALAAGDEATLLGMFLGDPVIDDPIDGHVFGIDATREFASRKRAWLLERNASVKTERVTRGFLRSVAEVTLQLIFGERTVMLPVAIVADHGDSGEAGKVRAIRVYHSMWPLEGAHRQRPPLLNEDPNLELPDVIAKYQRALAKGNTDAIVSLFDPNGYAREPSGGEYVYRGTESLRLFYGGLFASGGLPLEHCTATDDGICCAVEYNVTRWGRRKVPAQAGVGVYERGPSGLLAAARIYDDVAVEEGAPKKKPRRK